MKPTVFHVVITGYWDKFSISNNHASVEPHRLWYCHCAKLTFLSTYFVYISSFCTKQLWVSLPVDNIIHSQQTAQQLGLWGCEYAYCELAISGRDNEVGTAELVLCPACMCRPVRNGLVKEVEFLGPIPKKW